MISFLFIYFFILSLLLGLPVHGFLLCLVCTKGPYLSDFNIREEW